MGRSPCCDKDGLKKGPWTPEEDQKLIDYIQKHGYGNWRTLPKNAGLQRCGKSCRLRWTNYLRPDIKRGRFSFEEEETIIQLHSILGNKWSAIAARLPGRTDNEIKNYWNTHIRKRLLRMGIDPVTHSPRLDLLDLSALLNASSSSLYNSSSSLGVQHLVNPELLKLATSLVTSQHYHTNTHNPYFQVVNPEGQTDQMTTPLVPFSQYQTTTAEHGYMEPFSSNTDQIGLGNSQINDHWQNNNNNGEYYYYVDYNNNNNNTSFQSVMSNLSTPSSSSPAPMNSNSTYTHEDEREIMSYCRNNTMFGFETIPHIFDVSHDEFV